MDSVWLQIVALRAYVVDYLAAKVCKGLICSLTIPLHLVFESQAMYGDVVESNVKRNSAIQDERHG